MYLHTNKGKNMTKITTKVNDFNFANLHFAACNVDQYFAKLEGALYMIIMSKISKVKHQYKL